MFQIRNFGEVDSKIASYIFFDIYNDVSIAS